MKSLRRASFGIIDKIRLKQGLVARSRGNTVSSQSKSSNQSTNGTHLTQRDSREELQSINAQLSSDNALLRRQLSEKERKLGEKDRTIGNRWFQLRNKWQTATLSCSILLFWKTCIEQVNWTGTIYDPFVLNSFDFSWNQIKDTLKEQYEKELKAREETIQRLQDIIDKSIGGFVSLSRPAEADRSSYYEGVSPTTPSIQAAFKPELLTRYFFLFKKSFILRYSKLGQLTLEKSEKIHLRHKRVYFPYT